MKFQETAFFDGPVALSSLRMAFADAGRRTLKILTSSNVQDNKTSPTQKSVFCTVLPMSLSETTTAGELRKQSKPENKNIPFSYIPKLVLVAPSQTDREGYRC
jgi:hypothetical protein